MCSVFISKIYTSTLFSERGDVIRKFHHSTNIIGTLSTQITTATAAPGKLIYGNMILSVGHNLSKYSYVVCLYLKNKVSNMCRKRRGKDPTFHKSKGRNWSNWDTFQALRIRQMERISNIGHILLYKITKFSSHGFPKGQAPTMNSEVLLFPCNCGAVKRYWLWGVGVDPMVSWA